jgi:hypothetical protein
MRNLLDLYKIFTSGRGIYGLLIRLGLSVDISRRLTKLLRISFSFVNILQRKNMGHIFLKNNPNFFQIDQNLGYGFFDAKKIPWGNEVIKIGKKIFEEKFFLSEIKNKNDGKYFRSDLLTDLELKNYPEFMLFATNNEIVAAATKYLKTFPVLTTIRLWYSDINNTIQSSQYYHIDQEDYNQFKVFVNISDVNHLNGPITFIDAVASAKIYKMARNPFHRVCDDEIFKFADNNEVLELVGDSGSGAFVDTSSCFHMGSRTREGGRLLLMISFVAFPVIREVNHRNICIDSLPLSLLPDYTTHLLVKQ